MPYVTLRRRAAATTAAAVLAAVTYRRAGRRSDRPGQQRSVALRARSGRRQTHRAGHHHERRAHLQPSLGLLKPTPTTGQRQLHVQVRRFWFLVPVP